MLQHHLQECIELHNFAARRLDVPVYSRREHRPVVGTLVQSMKKVTLVPVHGDTYNV